MMASLPLLGVALLLTQQVLTLGYAGRTMNLAPERQEWVEIPAGEFSLGSTQRDLAFAVRLCQLDSQQLCERANLRSEGPFHQVRTSAYAIGPMEVSNAQYERCVQVGACRPRSPHRQDPRFDAPDLPVVDVTYYDALDYCRWRGGRLPTEAEWERAARGPGGGRFPWGQLWNGALCNHGRGTMPHHDESDGYRYLAPVTAFPASRSAYGLLNAAGNVWEWVADWYGDDTYDRGAFVADPEGPSFGSHRVIRGGSWASPAFSVRATTRGRAEERERSIDIGIRCAWDR